MRWYISDKAMGISEVRKDIMSSGLIVPLIWSIANLA